LSSREGDATMKGEEGGKGGDGAAKGNQAFEK
jgi:hypothetical protein